MKKINFIALALLAFAACSKSNDEPVEPVNPVEPRTAVQVTNTKIVGSTDATPPDTRATDTAWEAGDAIGLVLLEAGTTTPLDGKTTLKYTTATTAGSFQPADEANTGYLPGSGKAADILAFYPHTTIGTDLMIPVSTADQSALNRIDLMVADKSTGHNSTKPEVNLTFSHKLAKLMIILTKDASDTDVDLTGATITLSGTATTAKWSLTDARLTDQGADTDITLAVATNKDDSKATAIVLPTATGKTVELTLTTAAQQVYILKADADLTLTAGYKHTLTLIVSKTALTIGSFAIAPWTETSGNGNLDWQ